MWSWSNWLLMLTVAGCGSNTPDPSPKDTADVITTQPSTSPTGTDTGTQSSTPTATTGTPTTTTTTTTTSTGTTPTTPTARPPAPGELVINEVLYDPVDDANCDGTYNTTQDEFVEIVNRSDEDLLLRGVVLSDTDQARHVFGAGAALPAQSAAVIFGGGTPTAPGTPPWHCGAPPEGTWVDTASSGRLSLNNTGDALTLTLEDGEILDSVSYAASTATGQSMVRWPEADASSPWVRHGDVAGALGSHSPARRVDGRAFTDVTTAPVDTASDTGFEDSSSPADTGAPEMPSGLILNELMADPGDLDANCDGIVDTLEDEYIEIVNTSDDPIDLSGATLSDEVTVRHLFGDDAWIDPGHVWVVFSGGSPSFDGGSPSSDAHCLLWPDHVSPSVASTGRLALNNTGDTLQLQDSTGGILIHESYGSEANHDQSLTRSPDLSDTTLVQHSMAEDTGRRLSPGTRVDGSAFLLE